MTNMFPRQNIKHQKGLNLFRIGFQLFGLSIIFCMILIFSAIFSDIFSIRQVFIIALAVLTLFILIIIPFYFLFYRGLARLNSYVNKMDHKENVNMKNFIESNNTGIFESLFEVMNQHQERSNNLLKDIYASSARISPMADELNNMQNNNQQNFVMQEQLGARLDSAFSQVYQSTKSLNEGFNKISKEISSSNQMVQRANSAASKTSHSIQQSNQHLDEARTQIEDLQNSSHKINNIIDVINSIADQTNLLALNAAIEAARAGEQGRGFAVVADEVRNLAKKTSESTSQVSEMVGLIQQSTASVSNAISTTSKSSAITLELSSESSNYLENTLDSIDLISQLSAELLVASNQQKDISDSAQQEISTMMQLNATVKDSGHAQELTANDMFKLASRLKSMIETFEFNHAVWDEEVREKKSTITDSTEKEEEIEMF